MILPVVSPCTFQILAHPADLSLCKSFDVVLPCTAFFPCFILTRHPLDRDSPLGCLLDILPMFYPIHAYFKKKIVLVVVVVVVMTENIDLGKR